MSNTQNLRTKFQFEVVAKKIECTGNETACRKSEKRRATENPLGKQTICKRYLSGDVGMGNTQFKHWFLFPFFLACIMSKMSYTYAFNKYSTICWPFPIQIASLLPIFPNKYCSFQEVVSSVVLVFRCSLCRTQFIGVSHSRSSHRVHCTIAQ